jgi:hypothetical protein
MVYSFEASYHYLVGSIAPLYAVFLNHPVTFPVLLPVRMFRANSVHLILIILAGWMVAFRVLIPLYMEMALSQFITYLLILIVGEKEKKIKEGMKIMGLRDSVFW